MIRLVVAVLASAVCAAGAAAAPHRAKATYYLALGDSIAYGVQPDKVTRGLPPSAFDTGYVDVVAAKLRGATPQLRVVNYSCPGESTVTFTRGTCPWVAEGRRLHDASPGTQLQAALAFLRAHRGHVRLITLTLWGNDVIPAFQSCNVTFTCVRSRAPAVIAGVASRLGSILRRLRASAPGVKIVVTGVWNFDDERPELSDVLFVPLDVAIARAAGRWNVRVAPLLSVFNPPGRTKARLCAYTFICSADDVHPTDAGYRAIASAILTVA